METSRSEVVNWGGGLVLKFVQDKKLRVEVDADQIFFPCVYLDVLKHIWVLSIVQCSWRRISDVSE